MEVLTIQDLTIATVTVTVLGISSVVTHTGKDNAPIPIILAVTVGSSTWNLRCIILFWIMINSMSK